MTGAAGQVIDTSLTLPTERGGWWHEYVCPAHGTELLHDGLFTGRFPEHGARCPYGCRLDTPAIRGAWTVLAHQACARRLRDLALDAGPAEREAVLRRLTDYAELYDGQGRLLHDGSQSWMLRGRLFHQALTEAIWAVNLGRAAWVLHDHGIRLGDPVTGLLEALATAARQARDTLVEQGKSTSNYVAWLDAAGAVCSRDEAWLTDHHGIYAHILAATLPDGWQWEASTYYHSFVLRACRVAIAGVPRAEPPPQVAERLAAMRRVLLELRAPNGELPALHDGPYRRPDYDAELAELRLDEAPVTDPITVHRDGGYAILRRPGLHAMIAFGPHGGSHGHLDKLTLSLSGRRTAWQVDPGQVPYGHRPWRAHYASTVAHATFSIDGDDQAECTGRLVASDDTAVTTGCDTAYPGVSATRTLRLTETGMVDQLTVRCDRPRRIALHLRPAVDCDVEATGAGFATRWHGDAETLTGRHQASGPAQLRARSGPAPADDPQRALPHLDWVAEDCTEITFTSTYESVDHDSDR